MDAKEERDGVRPYASISFYLTPTASVLTKVVSFTTSPWWFALRQYCMYIANYHPVNRPSFLGLSGRRERSSNVNARNIRT